MQAWLAGPARHDHMAEWSLAGDVLQFSTAGPWAASLPVEYWPEDEEPRAAMLADMEPGIGDRCGSSCVRGVCVLRARTCSEPMALTGDWRWFCVKWHTSPVRHWPVLVGLVTLHECCSFANTLGSDAFVLRPSSTLLVAGGLCSSGSACTAVMHPHTCAVRARTQCTRWARDGACRSRPPEVCTRRPRQLMRRCARVFASLCSRRHVARF